MGPGLREQLARAPASARAFLPIRLFFGATFLYAGFDKLVDPRFFDSASAASIQSQMAAFTRTSPLAPLVRLGEPAAVPIGLAIAVAEIAIGLGALTGLAFRLSALGGAALSLLFFLTASWSIRPYYYGPDLPYAAGWIALALAGHGDLFVVRRLIDWAGEAARDRADPRTSRRPSAREARARSSATADRRSVLQAGVLGLIALVAASLAVPFRLAGVERPATDTGDGSGASDRPVGSASGGPGSTPASTTAGASAPPASGSLVVAKVGDLAKTGAKAFTVPFNAPAPLTAGDPAMIVRLTNGSFVAFDAVCTHAGCTVEWDRADGVLYCPCHGAAFDPASNAAVIQGPTNVPLPGIPIVVDSASGTISLRA